MNHSRSIPSCTRISSGLLLLVELGCAGKVADLGTNAPGPAPAPAQVKYAKDAPEAQRVDGATGKVSPWKLVDGLGVVNGIGVEQGRVFWTGRTVTGDAVCDSIATIYTCDVANCSSTVRSWPDKSGVASDSGGQPRIEVAGGWAHFFDVWGGFWSCGLDDCGQPTHSLSYLSVHDLFSDQGGLYALGYPVVVSCDVADCDNSVQRVPLRAPAGVASFINGSRMVADEEELYIAEEQRILRVPRDGSLPFVVVVESSASIGELAVDSDKIYWSEPMQGTISACPKVGCQGSPEVLKDNLSNPSTVLVDDSNAYFVELTWGGNVGRLSRCSKSNCAASTVLAEGVGLGASLNWNCSSGSTEFAMDDRYVYFATCDLDLRRANDPASGEPMPPAIAGCGIGVIPK